MHITIQFRVKQLIDHYGGCRAAARAIDIYPGYLSRLGTGEADNPSKETLKMLGLEKMVSYRARYDSTVFKKFNE